MSWQIVIDCGRRPSGIAPVWWSRVLSLTISILLLAPPLLLSQGGAITLRGIVQDSSGAVLSGVDIEVDSGVARAISGSGGEFRLTGLTAGVHWLSFRKVGFKLREIRATLTGVGGLPVTLETVVMTPLPVRRITLSGTVTGAISREPLEAVTIDLDGRVIGHTDGHGGFRITGVPVQGGQVLRFRRIGHAALVMDFWPPEAEDLVQLRVTLKPRAVVLGPLLVEGDRASSLPLWLQGFEQRRRAGRGRFLTREQIDQLPSFTAVNLLPFLGARVVGDYRSGGARATVWGVSPSCGPPTYLINGVQWPEETAMFHLEIMGPEMIAGIEVHNRPGTLPVELAVFNPECGVIVIWTRR